MKINRLSEKLCTAINEQMTNEAFAAQIYLSYAAWAENLGYSGIANFLFRHAAEERNHMMKFFEYILKRGAKVKVTAIPAPNADPSSINNCFEKVFKDEVANTKSIYKLVKMSLQEEDWATWNFMQWFVNEQIEEENLAISLLDKIKIAGGEKASAEALYALDKDIGKTLDSARMAQDVSTSNP